MASPLDSDLFNPWFCGMWSRGTMMNYPMQTMVQPDEIAKDIAKILPNVKRGTLRFWGKWFGRPFDNYHWLIGCEASGDCLRLRFNDDEVLAVWNPSDVEINETTFRIGRATAVRWTWYYHGRPKTPDNLRYLDYAEDDGRIAFRTNGNTIRSSDWLEQNAATYPAVEMPDFRAS